MTVDQVLGRPRRALLSVSDKRGILDFARGLHERGLELVSTGGTARALAEAGLPVTPVSEITGHAEIMDGRVKTLHPAIHGPLLARRQVEADMEALAANGYGLIDVVAVNLYPFRETIARGGVGVDEAMEQVDIGGPTMIRAAAKNHAHVLVVVDPDDYGAVLDALDAEGEGAGDAEEEARHAFRRGLAAKVFRHVSGYDEAVAAFLAHPDEVAPRADLVEGAGVREEGSGHGVDALLPGALTLELARRDVLRYGENPDQGAALYLFRGEGAGVPPSGIAGLVQHHGKALSYNNLLDLDGALLALAPFAFSPEPAVAIVKHTTPCGVAVGRSVADAWRKALATDPVSAFGSIIAVNREVDGEAAGAMAELFVECIVAPSFSDEALGILTAKKNLRLLTLPDPVAFDPSDLPLAEGTWDAFVRGEVGLEGTPGGEPGADALRAAPFLALHGRLPDARVLRGIYGGVLVQSAPVPPFFGVEDPGWEVVTERVPTRGEARDLAFAWVAVAAVKSNAILLARDGATVGIGAGQMSRVDSSRLAVWKAGEAGLELAGCALASDAFFPFRDGVDAAAEAGVRSIIQPGGSVRDAEVIEAANEHGIAMVFTGRRLFRH
jgi:phosphoribosylaminoimidazolecarboxamide formyltransferase / IMP cyclohydrolase